MFDHNVCVSATGEKMVLFWGGPFSQWAPSEFTIRGVTYNCAEQFMMAEKARLFGDEEIARKIMTTDHPADQKALGKQVRGFVDSVWRENAKLIVYRGNYANFTQTSYLMDSLMETKGMTLVEASPYDVIWGIGLHEDDPACADRSKWRGTNWLGECITAVRLDKFGE